MWKPKVSVCQMRVWTGPYAARTAPASASERWTTRRSARKSSQVRYIVSALRATVASRRAAITSITARWGSELEISLARSVRTSLIST